MPDPAKQLKAQSRIVAFRSCEIWFCEEKVVLDSTTPLPDLKLREFARARIFFEGQCYHVSEKSQSSDKPTLYRYVLTPWPRNDEASTRKIVLDEQYFQGLADERRRERLEKTAFQILAPFYPLLGFLWSPQKRALNQIGFESHTMSSFSIFVSFLVGLLCGAFLVVFAFGANRFPVPLLAGTVVFMLDAIMRYDRFIAGRDHIPPGFYEWLLHPKETYE